MFIRSEFNYDADEASLESGCDCKDPSLAIQSQFEESDINTIVRRFGLGGVLPQDVRVPLLEDFDAVFDFQSAMNAIREAEHSFMRMPAAVRARFGNDPQEFVEFCSDEKNVDEMVKLGLAVKRKVEDTPVVPDEPVKE